VLGAYLAGYDQQELSFLTRGFSEGFRIPFEQNKLPKPTICKNHPSALTNKKATEEKLLEEIKQGRIVGPFVKKPGNLICSPLALIPKSEKGKFRLIHDLSYPKGKSVNDSISRQFTEVHYDSIDTIVEKVKQCGRHSLMAKTDIENAFRLIPIHHADRFLLGFSWEFQTQKQFFMDACLAMGLNISCQIFTRFSNALQWIMETKYGANVSHIIDDFCFVGPSDSNLCKSSLENFLTVCRHIQIPIKYEKTVTPTTKLIIYGIEVDSENMIIRLPQDKVEKIKRKLSEIQKKRKITLKQLQSIIGLLNFACGCIVPGRAFLRRLYDLTKGVTRPSHFIRLNMEARADFNMWGVFMQSFNGRCMFLQDDWVDSQMLHLYTDASSKIGFSAVFGSEWVADIWQDSFKEHHINVLELIPIVIAVAVWGKKMSNHKIKFHSDNEA